MSNSVLLYHFPDIRDFIEYAVSARTTSLMRPLMVRQPYLKATGRGGFLFFPEGEKTDIRSEAFFNGKEERLLFGRVLRGIYREIMEMFERIK